eukprot:403363463
MPQNSKNLMSQDRQVEPPIEQVKINIGDENSQQVQAKQDVDININNPDVLKISEPLYQPFPLNQENQFIYSQNIEMYNNQNFNPQDTASAPLTNGVPQPQYNSTYHQLLLKQQEYDHKFQTGQYAKYCSQGNQQNVNYQNNNYQMPRPMIIAKSNLKTDQNGGRIILENRSINLKCPHCHKEAFTVVSQSCSVSCLNVLLYILKVLLVLAIVVLFFLVILLIFFLISQFCNSSSDNCCSGDCCGSGPGFGGNDARCDCCTGGFFYFGPYRDCGCGDCMYACCMCQEGDTNRHRCRKCKKRIHQSDLDRQQDSSNKV